MTVYMITNVLCSYTCWIVGVIIIIIGLYILFYVAGGIQRFRDYFDSTPTDGDTGMCILWGLAVSVVGQRTEWRRSMNIMCCGTGVFVTAYTGTLAIST